MISPRTVRAQGTTHGSAAPDHDPLPGASLLTRGAFPWHAGQALPHQKHSGEKKKRRRDAQPPQASSTATHATRAAPTAATTVARPTTAAPRRKMLRAAPHKPQKRELLTSERIKEQISRGTTAAAVRPCALRELQVGEGRLGIAGGVRRGGCCALGSLLRLCFGCCCCCSPSLSAWLCSPWHV